MKCKNKFCILTVPGALLHAHTIASTTFNIKSTILTIINDFCRCRCEYVKYERSKDCARNELVNEGQRIPFTTLPRLNAEYASLLNGVFGFFTVVPSGSDPFPPSSTKEVYIAYIKYILLII